MKNLKSIIEFETATQMKTKRDIISMFMQWETITSKEIFSFVCELRKTNLEELTPEQLDNIILYLHYIVKHNNKLSIKINYSKDGCDGELNVITPINRFISDCLCEILSDTNGDSIKECKNLDLNDVKLRHPSLNAVRLIKYFKFLLPQGPDIDINNCFYKDPMDFLETMISSNLVDQYKEYLNNERVKICKMVLATGSFPEIKNN